MRLDDPALAADFTEWALDSHEAFRGNFLTVHDDRVRLPDGSESRREYIRHPGAVVIVPRLNTDTFIVERQFRYPLHRHFIEFPAGKIDAGEAPLETAQRELLEETGYLAASWRHLATTHPCIGYADEVIEIFLADGLAYHGHRRDPGEFLAVHELARGELLAAIKSGAVTDAKTVVAMLWLEHFGCE